MKVYLGSDASPGSPKKQINDSMPPYLHSVVNEEAKKTERLSSKSVLVCKMVLKWVLNGKVW